MTDDPVEAGIQDNDQWKAGLRSRALSGDEVALELLLTIARMEGASGHHIQIVRMMQETMQVWREGRL